MLFSSDEFLMHVRFRPISACHNIVLLVDRMTGPGESCHSVFSCWKSWSNVCFSLNSCHWADRISTGRNQVLPRFGGHLKIGVEWLDDICPKVTAEAQASVEMRSGDITYAEYEKKLDREEPLRSASSH